MDIKTLKKQLNKTKNDDQKDALLNDITRIREIAENAIRNSKKSIRYGIREWSIDSILSKFTIGMENDTNELFIPDYQREYKWDNKTASRFIESILLNFPIPYLYISDVETPDDPDRDGRAEIIDGSQRIRALSYFVNNEIELLDLKEIHELEGFKFEDFSSGRQRRFLRESLKFVELTGSVDESTRRDLFERINSGSKKLVPMEERQGSGAANSAFFKRVLIPCSNNVLFSTLAPLSSKKRLNADHKEFILRFFAYLHSLEEYNGFVKPFLDQFLLKESKISSNKILKGYTKEFKQMLSFIDKHFNGMGFRKTLNGKTTPRARYEAISVGVALALKDNPNLKPAVDPSTWLTSEEFQEIVGADSANNTSQLRKRIFYVKNKLTKG